MERMVVGGVLGTFLVGLMTGGWSAAAEPEFAKPPTAVREGENVRIDFAVAAPTDATVDVVDGQGRVVRRLGAAALGAADAPPPFAKGLAQSILWDGTDDAGKPAPKGAYRARVRLGLGVAFDRYLGWTAVPPLGFDTVCGLAVGPDRSLYVIATSGLPPAAGRTETRLCVISPDGKYVRTLSPHPADADPKTLHGVDFLAVEAGRVTPRVYDRVCAALLPNMRALSRQTMTVTRDRRLVFVNGWATELYRFEPRSLMIMNTDGSIPRARINGPAIVPKGIQAGFPHVALSPDEQTAYVTGLHFGEYLSKPHQVVYRMGLGLDDLSEVFFGRAGETLKGTEGLDRPRGIATDHDGNVYVSDYGNDRIAVLSPAGALIGEIPLKGADTIAVHPKTGAIYALSMTGGKAYRLVKIASLKDQRVMAELDLAPYRGVVNPVTHVVYHPVIALDHYGEKPIVYLGYPSEWARVRVLRIVDDGAALAPGEMPVFQEQGVFGYPYPQGIDRDDNFYFLELRGAATYTPPVRSWRFDGRSGTLKPWKVQNQYRYAVGRDGLIYRAKWYQGKALERTNPDGAAVPFSATGDESDPYVDEWRFRRDNVHVTPSGEIWTLHFPTRASANALISMIGPDGRMQRQGVVEGLQAATSLRVDSRGNLYVADGLRRDGEPYPPEIDAFARRLREQGTTPRGRHSEAVEDTYGEAYGSILKFGPEGGTIIPGASPKAGEVPLAAYPGTKKYVGRGVKGLYGRISPMSPPRGIEFSACWCLHPMFDMDGYDRLFVPDAMQFCVRVLDANFNEILTFGRYGSGETAKKGDARIPFEFPSYAHASDAAVYVTDAAPCARRVLRVGLVYAEEKTCPVP